MPFARLAGMATVAWLSDGAPTNSATIAGPAGGGLEGSSPVAANRTPCGALVNPCPCSARSAGDGGLTAGPRSERIGVILASHGVTRYESGVPVIPFRVTAISSSGPASTSSGKTTVNTRSVGGGKLLTCAGVPPICTSVASPKNLGGELATGSIRPAPAIVTVFAANAPDASTFASAPVGGESVSSRGGCHATTLSPVCNVTAPLIGGAAVGVNSTSETS